MVAEVRKFGVGSDRNSGEELEHVVVGVSLGGSPALLLLFPQEHQAGNNVRRDDVQVPEEVGEEERYLRKGTLKEREKLFAVLGFPLGCDITNQWQSVRSICRCP